MSVAQTPEAVALELAKLMLEADGKKFGGGMGDVKPTRDEIVKAYSEALTHVKGNVV